MSVLLDIVLPKIPQYEDIPYSPGLCCTECGKADMSAFKSNNYVKPIVIGWCETNIGYMGVFECPHCHSKFRFHPGNWVKDIEQFEDDFWGWIELCENYEEIDKKVEEFKNG